MCCTYYKQNGVSLHTQNLFIRKSSAIEAIDSVIGSIPYKREEVDNSHTNLIYVSLPVNRLAEVAYS